MERYHCWEDCSDDATTPSRRRLLRVPPAPHPLRSCSDPANEPEQLIVAAAASCQMLSFLGAAARAGVTILGYEDTAASRLLLEAEPARLDTVSLDVIDSPRWDGIMARSSSSRIPPMSTATSRTHWQFPSR